MSGKYHKLLCASRDELCGRARISPLLRTLHRRARPGNAKACVSTRAWSISVRASARGHSLHRTGGGKARGRSRRREGQGLGALRRCAHRGAQHAPDFEQLLHASSAGCADAQNGLTMHASACTSTAALDLEHRKESQEIGVALTKN